LPPSAAQAFIDQYNIKVCEVFGMSETTQIYCMQTADNWQLGTIGQPLPGVEYQLRNSQGQIVEPGQIGELFVSSPCQASLYWKDWQKTREVFQGSWVRTGDQCQVNQQGNLVFMGRGDDLIKIKGLYVAPSEIENAIMCLSYVEDCTVVHALNSKGLSELHAFIISTSEIAAEQVQKQLQQYLPSHKIPRHVNFVNQLPKTLTNKKIRSILRKSIA
jgi:acyl-coenzyme A synthetase/AMP-(fatty) acid ligase